MGGIPEVLPPDMIYLAQARPKPLIEQLEKAIGNVNNIPVTKMHETVKSLYSWHNVAKRTEKVYRNVLEQPKENMLTKMKIILSNGLVSGIISVITYIMHALVLYICTILIPESSIERAIDFNCLEYISNPESYGNHLYQVYDRSVDS